MDNGRISRRKVFATACVPVAAGVAVLLKRMVQQGERRSVSAGVTPEVVIRETPVPVTAFGDYAQEIDVEDVRRILVTLAPSWLQANKVDNLVHALRLWGRTTEFPPDVFLPLAADATTLSGKEIFTIFQDSRAYLRMFPGQSPLLYELSDGVVAHTGYSRLPIPANGALVHQDTLLRTFSALGVSAATPLVAVHAISEEDPEVLRNEQLPSFVDCAVSDMVKGAMSYFVYEQEVEWTLEALARYIAPAKEWTNRFGQVCSFDAIAAQLLSRESGKGACLGLHGVYALVSLLRIDDQCAVVSPMTRDRIAKHIRGLAAEFEGRQRPDGTFAGLPGRPRPEDSFEPRHDWIELNQLVFIAHSLEWISIAPRDLRPNRTAVLRASAALIDGVRPWSMYARSGEYSPLSHAGVALSALIGMTPAEIVGGA